MAAVDIIVRGVKDSTPDVGWRHWRRDRNIIVGAFNLDFLDKVSLRRHRRTLCIHRVVSRGGLRRREKSLGIRRLVRRFNKTSMLNREKDPRR